MPRHQFANAVWQEENAMEAADFRQLLTDNPKLQQWIDQSKNLTVNILHADTSQLGKEVLWGSLIYKQSRHARDAQDVFHFYVSPELLVTSTLDFEEDLDMPRHLMIQQMGNAESPIEVMMILLGGMVGSVLHKIDGFEERLHQLLWNIKEHNNRQTLESIEEVRHEILLWKHLIMGFREISMAVEETFGEGVRERREYKRTSRRIDRCVMLVESYEDEIRNMVDMENVVANYRGNEIVKTLTVLTTLFTPVMAWGALWGMNFRIMPELELRYGYVLSIAVILTSTFLLYLYFKQKGWTGDILRSIDNKGKEKQRQD
ncbi:MULTISPECIES: magnesium transporter CorA family protein [unclassified Planococcus (in: firmicutes)]|uniref:magnesium transporter CorA family protein n=1 Tax=Planococcus TaxID=1372 RepID=UPI000C3313CC|nr:MULTISPECIES: magnesium transporter CorA family protein [unclassified Planococcus (in: firmicutes)]AUD12844.1 magnesium transporter CorA [Planococcus sp. MB-3u-03]PKG47462.1 magnesium transporter CorA [Planococcus sp. Urea-trap-24]PKG88214.1 magnesium transporter CorA [Planococcus sp. Urea-3u-39]PKH36861.1 magnesium transporter CorA [Planococcus sp. MB-3u-09]